MKESLQAECTRRYREAFAAAFPEEYRDAHPLGADLGFAIAGHALAAAVALMMSAGKAREEAIASSVRECIEEECARRGVMRAPEPAAPMSDPMRLGVDFLGRANPDAFPAIFREYHVADEGAARAAVEGVASFFEGVVVKGMFVEASDGLRLVFHLADVSGDSLDGFETALEATGARRASSARIDAPPSSPFDRFDGRRWFNPAKTASCGRAAGEVSVRVGNNTSRDKPHQ